MRYISGLTALLLIILIVPCAFASTANHFYTTGDVMEVDRCGSAWLIKRFIDHDATFKFYPKDQLITEGIPFDRPEGSLQRTHNAATFEVMLRKYELKDERLQQLGEIIHDVEINFWGKKENHLSGKVQAEIQQAINQSETTETFYKTCFAYFDNLFNELPTEKEKTD